MELKITSRAPQGAISPAEPYVSLVYEDVPPEVGRALVRRFLSFQDGEGGARVSKTYRGSSGAAKTIEIDCSRAVCIEATSLKTEAA